MIRISLLLGILVSLSSFGLANRGTFNPSEFRPAADTACCDSIDSIQITPYDSLIIVCDSGSVLLSVPFDTCYSYQWYRNGQPVKKFSYLHYYNATLPGTYYVVVSNDCYTVASNTVTVVINTTIHPYSNQTNVSCYGMCNGTATAGAYGGTPSYSILWSTGATTFQITNLCAGTYSYIITDSLGCTATDSVTITQPSELIVGGSCNCAGLTCTLTAYPSGGTPPYTYLWSTGATTQQITIPSSFRGRTVTVTDANGCTASRLFESGDCSYSKSSTNNENEFEIDVRVYPSPAEDFVAVEFSDIPTSSVSVSILDLTGRVIMEYNPEIADRHVYYFNLASLPEGIYVVRVRTDNEEWVNKVIKQ